MDVLGAEGTILTPEAAMPGGEAYQLSELQGLFLFSRADTIYGGSEPDPAQRAQRTMLGLPGATMSREILPYPESRPAGRQGGRRDRGCRHRHRLRHRQALRGGGPGSSSPTITSAA